MINKLLKYKCPSCGRRKLKAPAGFLGLPTACSDGCKTTLRRKAEQQFAIWRFTTKELNNVYWRTLRLLTLLDQSANDLSYNDFLIWLYLEHGNSKIELSRIYNGLLEGKNYE